MDSIIMMKFGGTKVGKEKLYCVNKLINTSDVNIDNIVTSKLVETN